jgi:hypothetical protein
MRRIGELLVADGLLSEDAVNRALGYQRLSGDRVRLGSILLNWDFLAEDALLTSLAKLHRCPGVDWTILSAAKMEAVGLLHSAHAARLAVIPYALERGALRVAFVNPSNLAAVDEVSAITGKRVISGVTTEVRLMQAHQKFYGRHIPSEFRTIVQKLERKTAQTRRVAEQRPAVDIGAAEPLHPGSKLGPSFSIPVEAAELDGDWLTPPEIPRPGRPTAPNRAQSRRDLSTPQLDSSASHPVGPPRHTDPQGVPRPATVPRVREDPIRVGEDSLTAWVGEALASFQQERGIGRKPAAAAPPATVAPKASTPTPAPPPKLRTAPAEDGISGMWRSSPLEDSVDEAVAGMWTPSEEAGPQLWEARSREEIGEAVLQNALTHLPRVILFGAGKTVISGWRGRGPNLTAEQIGSTRIPVMEESVFSIVEGSGVPHFGRVERADWPPALAVLLGPRPLDCAIFPIRILDGVAAFLYADRLGEPMQYEDFGVIARTAASTANILARFLLRPNTAPVG